MTRRMTVMKNFFVVILALILISVIVKIGYSSHSKIAYNPIPYLLKAAVRNGDVVMASNGKRYNAEKLDEFLEYVKSDKKDKIRITRYTTEGGAIIMDLDYDGKRINYTYDTTRDGMGERKVTKKKLKSDSIYKRGSIYYIKDDSGEMPIY
jgi:hypothetical protein